MPHKSGFWPFLTLRAYSAGVASELVSEPCGRNQSSLVFQSVRVKRDMASEGFRAWGSMCERHFEKPGGDTG